MKTAQMGAIVILLSALAITGCSHFELVQPIQTDMQQAEQSTGAHTQRTSIDGRPVTSFDSIRTLRDVYLVASTDRFADIVSASGRYLIEVEAPCEELVGAAIKSCVPGGVIRVQQSEVCGCTVLGIYSYDAGGD